MRIEHDLAQDLYKVVDPSLELDEIYLTSEILQYLESQGQLEFLEDMIFSISRSDNSWTILGPIPTGTPGTLASFVFFVMGTIQPINNKVVCIIP